MKTPLQLLLEELRTAQGDGSDWTEELFGRAADAIEKLMRGQN